MVEGKVKCTYTEIFRKNEKGMHKVFSLQGARFCNVAFLTDWVDPDERYVPVLVTDAAVKYIKNKDVNAGSRIEVSNELVAKHPEYQLYVKNVAVEWNEAGNVNDPQLDILGEAQAEAERQREKEAKKKKKSIIAALLATVAATMMS